MLRSNNICNASLQFASCVPVCRVRADVRLRRLPSASDPKRTKMHSSHKKPISREIAPPKRVRASQPIYRLMPRRSRCDSWRSSLCRRANVFHRARTIRYRPRAPLLWNCPLSVPNHIQKRRLTFAQADACAKRFGLPVRKLRYRRLSVLAPDAENGNQPGPSP